MKTFYSTSRCFAILVCLSSLAISSVCPSSSSSPSFSSTTPTIAVNSIAKDSHEVSSSKHSSAEELPRGTIEESSNDSFEESSEDLSDDSSETTDHTVTVTTTNTNINTTNVDYTASSSEEVYRDLRTVQNLQRYIGLFQQWSLAFVSGPNLYLVRFEEPAKIEESGEFVHQVVTSNLTLKPLFNGILDASLPSEEMDDDGQRQLSMGETSPRSTLSPDAATSFKRMQYHRSTNTLIFLDRSGYLFTLNTANLATNRLHTSSSRVLDFSLNENTNVVYYATEDGGMVKVLRLFLQRDPNGSDHVWLDDSIVNTVLAVYVTRPESVRLHVDYGTNSLYLFIIINARVFTYEVKLFYDDTTETNTCDARCNRRFEVVRRISKFRVSRPLLNFNYYEYVKTRGLCEIVNFQTTRDRLIEIEFNCPNHSPHVERLNAGRMANWLKDLHKSNVTFDWLTYNYLYSTIMDTNRLLPGEEKYESLPVRIVIERSEKSNGRNIRHDLYMERVGFMSRSDLYVYNTTAYKNTQLRNRQTRKHIGIVDGISSYGFWRDVENVECMLVRTKELFRDVSTQRVEEIDLTFIRLMSFYNFFLILHRFPNCFRFRSDDRILINGTTIETLNPVIQHTIRRTTSEPERLCTGRQTITVTSPIY